MTVSGIQKIIDKAKKDFEDQILVAFLGDKFSGKTVQCALIKDAVARYLRDATNGEYYGIGTDGSERMNLLIKKLHNGEFPAKTTPDEATPMTIEIHSKTGAGGVMKIVLRDMAGEQGEDLLQKEMGVDDRLEKIFKVAPIDGKPYGLLTHLIFAKIYIILIDCSKYDRWSYEQAYVKDTLRSIFEIKKRIGEITNNKLTSHIAIVFSKYDTLKEPAKPPKELLKELQEIETALDIFHEGSVECFISKVDSVPLDPKEIDLEIKKKLDSENKEKAKLETLIPDKEAEKKNAINELNSAKENVNEIQERLNQVKPTNDPNQINPIQEELNSAEDVLSESQETVSQITEELDDARKNLRTINEEIEKGPRPQAEELGISIYKPKNPLAYSKEDYLDLIKWLISKHKQIRGF